MSATSASDTSGAHRARRFKTDRDVVEWQGDYRRYDIAKEVLISFLVVLVLVVACAIVFSSPDDPPVTVKSWSNAAPVDFAQTAMAELNGTSGVATYGPPYTNTAGQPEARPDLARARCGSQDPDQHRPGLRAEAACDTAEPPSS